MGPLANAIGVSETLYLAAGLKLLTIVALLAVKEVRTLRPSPVAAAPVADTGALLSERIGDELIIREAAAPRSDRRSDRQRDCPRSDRQHECPRSDRQRECPRSDRQHEWYSDVDVRINFRRHSALPAPATPPRGLSGPVRKYATFERPPAALGGVLGPQCSPNPPHYTFGPAS